MKLHTFVFLFCFLYCGFTMAESEVSEADNNKDFQDKAAKSVKMKVSKNSKKKENKRDEYLKKVLASEEEGLTQKTNGTKEEGESNENSTTSVSNDDTKESEVTTDQSVSTSNITGVDTDTTNENTTTIPTSAESSKNDSQNETPVKLDLKLEEIAQKNNTSVEATSKTNKDNNEKMMEEISSEPNKEGEIVTDSSTKVDTTQVSDISVDTEITTIEPQTPILESVTKNTLEQLNEIGSIIEQLMKTNNTSNNGTASISTKELEKVNDLVKGLTRSLQFKIENDEMQEKGTANDVVKYLLSALKLVRNISKQRSVYEKPSVQTADINSSIVNDGNSLGLTNQPDIEDENKDSEGNLFAEGSFVWTPSKQDEQPNKGKSVSDQTANINSSIVNDGNSLGLANQPDIEDENKDSKGNLFVEESFVWTPSKQDEQPNKGKSAFDQPGFVKQTKETRDDSPDINIEDEKIINDPDQLKKLSKETLIKILRKIKLRNNLLKLPEAVKKPKYTKIYLTPKNNLNVVTKMIFERPPLDWTTSRQDEKQNKEKSGRRPDEEKLKPFLNIIKDMITRENMALQQYDWLGTIVDILAALEKLTKLFQSKDRTNLNPADAELFKYTQYLYFTSKAKNKNTYSQETKKQLREIQQHNERDIKIRKRRVKTPSLLQRRKLKNLNRIILGHDGLIDRVWPYKSRLSETENKAQKRIDELQDFVEDLRDALYDLHNTLKNIAILTKFKKQNWFNNLKVIYLEDAEKKQYLEVLLHISAARLLSLIEDSAMNGLEDAYQQYIRNNQEVVEKTQKEFVFLMQVLGELKNLGE